MREALAPRGPDGVGEWSDSRVALGHRRLATIDRSDAGAQPFTADDLASTIVMDGCIYNHAEVRAELAGLGHRFVSRSDTEVLLRAWSEWGDAALERLAGMFAFAIVDHATGEVVLARDRMGVKPLYLHRRGGRTRFASTLPALLAAGDVGGEIDPIALHHYLTFHAVVPAPRTILAEVRKVEPATIMRISADGSVSTRRYWSLDFDVEPPEMTPTEWQTAVLESLRRAVRLRAVADVPVGVLLSGGLDSSLITALMVEDGHNDLQTFTIGFESHGDIDGDEFEYSDLVARTFDTDHHQLRIPSADLPTALTRAIGAMSEPMVSHDVVAFYLLSEAVRTHLSVVQSGQGADEVFAGYRWYPPLADVAPPGVEEYAREFFDRDHAGVAALVQPPFLADRDVSREFVTAHFAEPGAARVLDAALRLDSQVMAVEDPVKRVDNMTMAHGLEARMPFLDHELVELAAMCPAELKLAHGGKGVLKDAARSVLPAGVIDRPKGYFPVPALSHLEGTVLELVIDTLRSPAAKDRGLFRADAVDALIADPNGHLTPLNGNPLWQVALLELWLQEHGL